MVDRINGAGSAAADLAAEAGQAKDTSADPTAEEVLEKTAELFFKTELMLFSDMFRRDILPQRTNLEKAFEDQGKKAMEGH